MGKIPYTFAVFFNGLIFGQTLKNQETVFNLIFNGRLDAASHHYIKAYAASAFVTGAENIPDWRVESMFSLPLNDVVLRIRAVNILDPKQSASAFHAFLRDEVTVPGKGIADLEEIISGTNDPYQYIARALLIALQYDDKPYVLSPELRAKLRSLHKSNTVVNLFPGPPRNSAALALSDTALAAVVDAAVPTVVRGVLSILFLGGGMDANMLEHLRAGEFDAALEASLDKGGLSLYEYYKCGNFLKIAERAEAILHDNADDDSSYTQSDFDFDWFLRFFDAAGNIRDEDMQNLWAKVLAGEIRAPGSFSLRTVETLRNMTVRDALAFQRACSLVLRETDGSQFIFCDSDLSDSTLNERYGVSTEDILGMEECGLISALRFDNEVTLGEDDGAAGFTNDGGLILLFDKKTDDAAGFHYKSYPLSQTARQLLLIVQSEVEEEYLLDLGRAMRNDIGQQIDVSAHKILSREGNDIELDLEHDLL